MYIFSICFFFQAEDGIRDIGVTGVQTCALPICLFQKVKEPLWWRNANPLCRAFNIHCCLINRVDGKESNLNSSCSSVRYAAIFGTPIFQSHHREEMRGHIPCQRAAIYPCRMRLSKRSLHQHRSEERRVGKE